ncbi:MAG: DALR anticodon-binding domain-containing protein, partial [Candidatus Pacebacteria bacterium]|nr:DALR anticodon-binding domain-containing protein [Candidatus Paceibacterota bacterium]
KKLSQAIAISALKFNNLKSFRTLDVVFDWEQMLDFSGDTSVYLQYTYARINKILFKSKKIKNKNLKIDYKSLSHPLEIQLVKKLSEFPEIIKLSALKYAPNYLATFLLSLADLTNKYYESVPILKDKSLNLNRILAQLVLLECITDVIEKGFKILGVQALKEI